MKAGVKWSDEEIQILHDHYPTTSTEEILDLLPIRNIQTIRHKANLLGIQRVLYNWSPEEDSVLHQFYHCKTVKELIKLLPGRTNNGIKLRARKLDLWQGRSLCQRKYTHDTNFFAKPNVTNSYYAGLIAADGCVTSSQPKLIISLKSDDGYLIEQFVRDIKYTGNIRYFNGGAGPNSVVKDKSIPTHTASVTICGSTQVISDLEKNFNIVPNKTLILQPPINLDYECSLAYIVGYIDGDGCISLKHTQNKVRPGRHYLCVGVAGTLNILNWIKSVFDRVCSNTRGQNANVCKQDRIHIYRVGAKRAYHILKELQSIPTPTRLARKWDKVKEYESSLD